MESGGRGGLGGAGERGGVEAVVVSVEVFKVFSQDGFCIMSTLGRFDRAQRHFVEQDLEAQVWWRRLRRDHLACAVHLEK